MVHSKKNSLIFSMNLACICRRRFIEQINAGDCPPTHKVGSLFVYPIVVSEPDMNHVLSNTQ